jgi:hypothetical protein
MNRDDQLRETTDELITEVIRVAVTLDDVFTSDIPEEAFPGEDNAKVLFDMLLGTIEPATSAAGEDACRTAVALIGAIHERILADLHAAAVLAMDRGADS